MPRGTVAVDELEAVTGSGYALDLYNEIVAFEESLPDGGKELPSLVPPTDYTSTITEWQKRIKPIRTAILRTWARRANAHSLAFDEFGGGGQVLVDHKDSVRAATDAVLQTNVQVGLTLVATANNVMADVDGVTLIVGDRFLVKNEVAGSKNGIYQLTQQGIVSVQPWIATRTGDANTDALMTSGHEVRVEEGTANAGAKFFCATTGTITLGTTALVYGNATAAPTDIIIPDLTGTAFRIREAGAPLGEEWFRIDTSGNDIWIGRDAGSCTVQVVVSNNSQAFQVSNQSGAEWFRIAASGGGTISFGDSTLTPTYQFNMPSNSGAAFRVVDGEGRHYIECDTNGEEITLGNDFTDPDVVFALSDGQFINNMRGVSIFAARIVLPEFTVVGVPSASPTGQVIIVTDETGGRTLATSDAVNWRRVSDGAIIS
jgi:hypothetical protein